MQEAEKPLEDLSIYAAKRWHGLRERFLKDAAPRPGLDVLGSTRHAELALRTRAEGQA